jgi:hypothetical protein
MRDIDKQAMLREAQFSKNSDFYNHKFDKEKIA